MSGSLRHLAVPVLAALPLLSGCCATVALWRDEQPQPVVVADTTVEVPVHCAVTAGNGLLLQPAGDRPPGDRGGAWR
ncbi:MAG: hypothetical protein WAT39_00055, partial [Planctomycetota bacterium]